MPQPSTTTSALVPRRALELLGPSAGDVAEVQAPGGVRHWEIVDVRYA